MSGYLLVSAFVFAALISTSTAAMHPFNTTNGGVYGADVSTAVSSSAWSCLKSSYGVSFAIIRCYESLGRVDGNCPGTVANAWAAGLSHVDIYHFPDVHKDANTQAQELASYVSSRGIKFGSVWIDVEPYSGGWGSDHAANVNFLSSLRTALQKYLGHTVGFYASPYGWSEVTGGSTAFSGSPLWYAHWDENASFSDFSGFGGWGHPAMKQFKGDHSECGVGLDANWYP